MPYTSVIIAQPLNPVPILCIFIGFSHIYRILYGQIIGVRSCEHISRPVVLALKISPPLTPSSSASDIIFFSLSIMIVTPFDYSLYIKCIDHVLLFSVYLYVIKRTMATKYVF